MGIMCRGILKMVEAVECFEYGRISPGLGFDYIEEIACMDEHVRFLLDDLILRSEEIVIDLLFPQVHPALGIEAVERS